MNDQPHRHHDWARLGNMEVCKKGGCPAYRAVTPEAEAELERLGLKDRQPMKETTERKAHK